MHMNTKITGLGISSPRTRVKPSKSKIFRSEYSRRVKHQKRWWVSFYNTLNQPKWSPMLFIKTCQSKLLCFLGAVLPLHLHCIYHLYIYCIAGVPNLWPGGQNRPTTGSNLARRINLQSVKITQKSLTAFFQWCNCYSEFFHWVSHCFYIVLK